MNIVKWLKLKLNLSHLGKRCHLGCNIRSKHGKFVWVGDRVTIGDYAFLYAHPHNKASKAPIIIIGNGSHLGEFNYLSARTGIVIGKDVLFSNHVLIIDHSHGFEDVNTPIMHQPVDNIIPISIGDGSWIGMHVSILPGASIGRNCVIGVNSVVNQPIPDYCVAVGSPARIIKHWDPTRSEWIKGAPSAARSDYERIVA